MKEAGFRLFAEWASDESGSGRGFAYAAYNGVRLSSRSKPFNRSVPDYHRILSGAYGLERQISLMGINHRPSDLRPWIKHERLAFQTPT